MNKKTDMSNMLTLTKSLLHFNGGIWLMSLGFSIDVSGKHRGVKQRVAVLSLKDFKNVGVYSEKKKLK